MLGLGELLVLVVWVGGGFGEGRAALWVRGGAGGGGPHFDGISPSTERGMSGFGET